MFLLWLGRAVAADWKLRLWCRESNVTPMVGTNLYCLFLFLFSLGFLPFFYFILLLMPTPFVLCSRKQLIEVCNCLGR